MPHPVTVTIQEPSGSAATAPVLTPIPVRGEVRWAPASTGFVQGLKVRLVRRSDQKLIAPGGLATLKDIAADGFRWSKTLTADQDVADGVIQAIAVDAHGAEVGRGEFGIAITPPDVTPKITRPAASSSFGIDSPIEVAGEVSWTPAKPNYVDSVKVLLVRNADQAIITAGIADVTARLAGRIVWNKTLHGDQGVADGRLRAAALDAFGNELNRTEIPLAIDVPTAAMTIEQPPSSPVPSFGVNTPIEVSGNVSWNPSSPNFVKGVQILLIRKADGVAMNSTQATIGGPSTTSASWKGTVSTSDHILDGLIRVLAFDKFQNVVARDEIEIRIP